MSPTPQACTVFWCHGARIYQVGQAGVPMVDVPCFVSLIDEIPITSEKILKGLERRWYDAFDLPILGVATALCIDDVGLTLSYRKNAMSACGACPPSIGCSA